MNTSIPKHYENVIRGTQKLSLALRRLNKPIGVAAELPKTPRGKDHDPVKFVSVKKSYGEEAIHLACKSYQDIHSDPLYSKRATRRTVGALLIKQEDGKEIAELIADINNSKEKIEQLITTRYESRKDRADALRESCPGVMTLHLYRQIRCFHDEHVSTISFSWLQKDLLIKANKLELLARIQNEIERSSEDYQLPLRQLLTKVASAPSEYLRQRRKVRPQPVANVTSGGSNRTIAAPMPVIIIQSQPVDIKMIGDFNPEKQRLTRSDKVNSQLLGTFGGLTIELFPKDTKEQQT